MLKKILLFIVSVFIIWLSINSVNATNYADDSCNSFPDSNSCGSCSDWGTVYEGETITNLSYSFYNPGPNNIIYFEDDNKINYTWNSLQPNFTIWETSNNLLNYTNYFTWHTPGNNPWVNLLKNPSFENTSNHPETPAYWTGTANTTKKGTALPSHGNYYAFTRKNKSFYQDVSIHSAKGYKLTFDAAYRWNKAWQKIKLSYLNSNKGVISSKTFNVNKLATTSNRSLAPWELSLSTSPTNAKYIRVLVSSGNWEFIKVDNMKLIETWCGYSSKYHIFKPWVSEKFLVSGPQKGIKLKEVKTGADRNKYAYKLTYFAKYRNINNGKVCAEPTVKTKRECVFYKPAFCWDWVVDTNKWEECDTANPGSIPSGKTCSNTCKLEQKDATCDWIEVDPSSWDAPLNANILCKGTNVTEWFNINIIDQFWNVIFDKNSNSWSADFKFSQSWKYTVKCYADKKINNQSCTKTVQVWEAKKASISIDKVDINPNDLDSKAWNDTQTIYKNNESIFRITVKNDWEVALKNIDIVDKLAPNCSGWGKINVYEILTYYTNIDKRWFDLSYNMNMNQLFEPGESFSYTCKSDKISEDYTNVISIKADPVNPDLAPVSDDDDSKVIIKEVNPKINIVIYSKNPNDLDWDKSHTPNDDTQTIISEDKWVFEVVVTNNWKEWLKDVYVQSNNPSCSKTKAELLALIKQTWNKDNILDPNEKVIYSCEKPNITSNEIITVDVIGTGVISGESVDDNDPTKVVTKNSPSVKIVKYSANPDDLDPNKWDEENDNDTQTVKKGSKAVFKIKVTNTWVEDLVDVKITDPKAPNCDKTFDELKVDETKTYTCEKDNTIVDYTNVASVVAKWKDTWVTTPIDSDPTEIKVVEPDPEIEIVIYSKNPDDLDWDTSHDPSDDSQKISSGNKWVFEVIVKNNWQEWLKDVYVESNNTNCSKTKEELLVLIKQTGNKDAILDPDEQIVYSCEKDNITSDKTITVDVKGTWVTSNENVIDNDPTSVLVESPSITIEKYSWNENDLDGTKTHDFSDDNQKVSNNAIAVFKITVKNNWTEDLKNVIISDTLAPNCNKTITELKVWIEDTYECERSNTTSNYTNSATVRAKWVNSNTPVTDTDTTEVQIDWSINSPEDIEIEKYSWNENDRDGTKTHTISDDSQTVYKGLKAVFKISVKNSWRVDLKDVEVTDEKNPECNKTIWNLAIGQVYDYECTTTNGITDNYTNTAKVTWKNENTGREVSDEDDTEILVTSGWGEECTTNCWGRTSTRCLDIDLNDQPNLFDWIEVTCEASKKTTNFRIDCWNGEYIEWRAWNTRLDWTENTKLHFSWVCAYSANVRNIKCEVSDLGHNRYRTSDSCENTDGIIPPPIIIDRCWDWILDEYPTRGRNPEQCDLWDDDNWTGKWCSGTCKLTDTHPDVEKNYICWDGIVWEREDSNYIDECDYGPDADWPKWCDKSTCKIDIITIPAGWELKIIFPEKNKIVWDAVDLFWPRLLGNNKKVILKNTWVRSLAFDTNETLNLIVEQGDTVLTGDLINNNNHINISNNLTNWFLQPGKSIEFTVWNAKTTTSDIGSSDDFADAKIIATIQTWDSSADDDLKEAYFARTSNIRVARPWVSTLGAWNTKYNTETWSTIDINNVNSSDNNFVGWNIWNTHSRTARADDNINTNNNTVSIGNNNATNSWTSYNWLSNVKIISWDVTIDNTFIIPTEATTFIVEWNLTIKEDITPNKNIAFVVKWWDLIIKNSVEELNWTYIVIGNNKKIKWEENTTTSTQLVVKGSLYWDINHLVSKRTYVDWNLNSDDALSIWTLLDFDSDLYNDPAPLLSEFLSEYTNAARIAR